LAPEKSGNNDSAAITTTAMAADAVEVPVQRVIRNFFPLTATGSR
jgi:hypothetical protein